MDDLGVEVVDGRDALGVVVIRALDDGHVTADIKSLRISKKEAAALFLTMARRLKAIADEEES